MPDQGGIPVSARSQRIEDLVVSVLAIYQYSLEKTYNLRDDLRREGVFDLDAMARKQLPDVVAALHAAGYQRGKTTAIFADRILELAQAARKGVLTEALHAWNAGQHDRADSLLLAIPGIGPRVLENFHMLQEPASNKTR
jgi:hypothetical protein